MLRLFSAISAKCRKGAKAQNKVTARRGENMEKQANRRPLVQAIISRMINF